MPWPSTCAQMRGGQEVFLARQSPRQRMVRAALAVCVVASSWRDAPVEESTLPWAKNMMETLPARQARLLQTSWPPDAVRATRCCPSPSHATHRTCSRLKKVVLMYAQADLFIIHIGRWRLYHPGRLWYLCFIVVGVGPAYIATS